MPTKKVGHWKRRDRHDLAFSRPLVQGQVSAPRASEARAFSCYRILDFYKSKTWCRVRVSRVKIILQNSARKMSKWGNLPNSVLCGYCPDDYSRSFPEFSSSERDIIGEPYRWLVNDWADRRAAATVPIKSCTKSYQHMRACTTALQIDPNMWRVRCFFSTA